MGDASEFEQEYEDELRRMAAATGFQDRIILTGYVQDIAALYNIMDVVVHTSIEPEPFGLVITEAMSHGVPVVASNLGATREIIDDGIDGILVDPKDTQKLAASVIKLLRNRNYRNQMGEKARAKVLQKYDADAYARRVEQVYREVFTSA